MIQASLLSPRIILLVGLAVALAAVQDIPAAAHAQDSPAVVVAPMDDPADVPLSQGTASAVPRGPDGQWVLRFDEPFAGRIDLAERGIDPGDYDLLTLQVKADRAAVLRVSLDHFPWSGKQARWYVLDGMRGPLGWRTLWIDLSRPEEGPRKPAATDRVTLHLRGSHKDTGRSIQPSNPAMMLGTIRAVRKTIDLDWNQTQGSTTRTESGTLIARYPLTVTNRTERPVTALLSTKPVQARYASIRLSASRRRLAPRARDTVWATLRLPAGAAARAQPLYAERFAVRARAEGVPHSTVTILRSSDPIHLPLTVPPPEESLEFPLLPPPHTLPDSIVRFERALAEKWARIAPASELIAEATARGLSNSEGGSRRFLRALIASAYLYDRTGEPDHLEKAARLLEALPGMWNAFYDQWAEREPRLISAGIIARMGDRPHFTLRLGWRLMGTQRSPYQYNYDHNARGGGMSALFYAFDMVAADLEPAVRTRIIEEFIVPAGIQCRNHYIGDGNQQATVNAVALYAGLAGRNWPLVSFAYSSEHGLPGILEWTFSDAGAHIRDGYQTYTLRPVFWLAELLYGRAKNIYDVYRERLQKAVEHPSFGNPYFWRFAAERRFSPSRPLRAPTALKARTMASGRVRLEWTDPATREVGFKVERSPSPDGGFTPVTTLTQFVPRYVTRCPTRSGTYSYRVRAYNYHAGPSAPSDTVNVSCPPR